MTSLTIYKCPICGAKKALTDDEQKNLRRLFCGSCSEAAEMLEDRRGIDKALLKDELKIL